MTLLPGEVIKLFRIFSTGGCPIGKRRLSPCWGKNTEHVHIGHVTPTRLLGDSGFSEKLAYPEFLTYPVPFYWAESSSTTVRHARARVLLLQLRLNSQNSHIAFRIIRLRFVEQDPITITIGFLLTLYFFTLHEITWRPGAARTR